MPSPKTGARGRREVPHLSDAPCYFDNDLFMARTTAILGADATDAQRAAHVGLSRSALNRLRAGDIGLSMHRARQICNTLDVTVDELFPPKGRQLATAAA